MIQTCIKCDVEFDFNRKSGNNHRRKHCLECVPLNANYLSIFNFDGQEFKCQQCDKKYIYKRKTHSSSKLCGYCHKKQYRDRSYEFINKIKKSGCIICGYKKCFGALVFHHKHVNEKDFSVAKRITASLDRIKAELAKCVILCANCHAEVHAGVTKLPK
ncbi:hypothetical protein LCGC14_1103230 [marine sediment metagenome]|uniref:HNH domain-containing protein n=1 Tax=marine sediment metagenome TaxID=412755 RepID=A0A0F9MWU4_9ZZZZ